MGKQYQIYTEEKNGSIRVLKFLEEQDQLGFSTHVAGMRTLILRYADGGRAALTFDQCHYADKDKGILEFRRGRLRIYFILVDSPGQQSQLVLLSHGVVKKQQKTLRSDKKEADRMRKKYMKALSNGELEID